MQAVQAREQMRPNPPMTQKEKEKYVETFAFPYCNEAGKYEKVAKIGQGTFGYVYIWVWVQENWEHKNEHFLEKSLKHVILKIQRNM